MKNDDRLCLCGSDDREPDPRAGEPYRHTADLVCGEGPMHRTFTLSDGVALGLGVIVVLLAIACVCCL